VTLEVDPRHADVAAANIARAGFDGVVEMRVGSAVETLAEQGALRHLAETYRAWGKLLRAHGREDEALDVFERAADLAVHTVAAPAEAGERAPARDA
jgi:predicted RNA polymerase sigma factor